MNKIRLYVKKYKVMIISFIIISLLQLIEMYDLSKNKSPELYYLENKKIIDSLFALPVDYEQYIAYPTKEQKYRISKVTCKNKHCDTLYYSSFNQNKGDYSLLLFYKKYYTLHYEKNRKYIFFDPVKHRERQFFLVSYSKKDSVYMFKKFKGKNINKINDSVFYYFIY